MKCKCFKGTKDSSEFAFKINVKTNKELSSAIESFSLQIINQRLEFSPINLFRFSSANIVSVNIAQLETASSHIMSNLCFSSLSRLNDNFRWLQWLQLTNCSSYSFIFISTVPVAWLDIMLSRSGWIWKRQAMVVIAVGERACWRVNNTESVNYISARSEEIFTFSDFFLLLFIFYLSFFIIIESQQLFFLCVFHV